MQASTDREKPVYVCPWCWDGEYSSEEEALENCDCKGAEQVRYEWYLEYKWDVETDRRLRNS